MKIKQIFTFGLFSIILLGCTNSTSPTFSYQLDGNTEVLHPNETIEQLCYEQDNTAYFYKLYYDKKTKQYEIDYDSEKDTKKNLGIYDIQIDDDLEEVLTKANIEKDFATYNYEYDPYHDGCTEIASGIYDGTIIPFDEKDVLDYVLQQRYDLIDGNWVIHSFQEDKDCKSYVMIYYTFSGSSSVYKKEQGKLMAISITYMQEK